MLMVARWHVANMLDDVAGILSSAGFKARYGLLCVSVTFSFASIPPLLSWLAANLRSTGALTLAIALNVSVGQIGEITGGRFTPTTQFSARHSRFGRDIYLQGG